MWSKNKPYPKHMHFNVAHTQPLRGNPGAPAPLAVALQPACSSSSTSRGAGDWGLEESFTAALYSALPVCAAVCAIDCN